MKIAKGPVTDGTLSTMKMADAIVDEARRVGADETLIERVETANTGLKLTPSSRLALAVHEAINDLRDAMNATAPEGLRFFENKTGRWGWWKVSLDA